MSEGFSSDGSVLFRLPQEHPLQRLTGLRKTSRPLLLGGWTASTRVFLKRVKNINEINDNNPMRVR